MGGMTFWSAHLVFLGFIWAALICLCRLYFSGTGSWSRAGRVLVMVRSFAAGRVLLLVAVAVVYQILVCAERYTGRYTGAVWMWL
jgi:hypothetical protein